MQKIIDPLRLTQKTSKKLSAATIPSTKKYLYGVCAIVNKNLSPTFDAVKLTPSMHNTDCNPVNPTHWMLLRAVLFFSSGGSANCLTSARKKASSIAEPHSSANVFAWKQNKDAPGEMGQK